MDPSEIPEAYRERLRAEAGRRADLRGRIAARGDAILAGDVLVSWCPIGGLVDWVVADARGGTLQVAAADRRTMALPGDVRVGDVDELVVRPFAAARVAATAFEPEDRVDLVEGDDLRRVQEAVGQARIPDVDSLDDDELAWAASLVRSARALEDLQQRGIVVVRLAEVRDPRLALSPAAPAAGTARLAASSASAADAWRAVEGLAQGQGLLVQELAVSFPGRIRLVATSRGVGLLCEPDEHGARPPAVDRRDRAARGPSSDEPRPEDVFLQEPGLGPLGSLPWDRAPDGSAQRVWFDVDWRNETPRLWLGARRPLTVDVVGEGAFES